MSKLSNLAVEKMAKEEWSRSIFVGCDADPKEAFLEAYMVGFGAGENAEQARQAISTEEGGWVSVEQYARLYRAADMLGTGVSVHNSRVSPGKQAERIEGRVVDIFNDAVHEARLLLESTPPQQQGEGRERDSVLEPSESRDASGEER